MSKKAIFRGREVKWVELYSLMNETEGKPYNSSTLSRALSDQGMSVTHVSISRYLSGERNPSPEVKQMFATFFDVDVKQLG